MAEAGNLPCSYCIPGKPLALGVFQTPSGSFREERRVRSIDDRWGALPLLEIYEFLEELGPVPVLAG